MILTRNTTVTESNYSELEIAFGEHKGKTIEEIPSSYLKWMRDNMREEPFRVAAELELDFRDRHESHFEE